MLLVSNRDLKIFIISFTWNDSARCNQASYNRFNCELYDLTFPCTSTVSSVTIENEIFASHAGKISSVTSCSWFDFIFLSSQKPHTLDVCRLNLIRYFVRTRSQTPLKRHLIRFALEITKLLTRIYANFELFPLRGSSVPPISWSFNCIDDSDLLKQKKNEEIVCTATNFPLH